MSRADAARAAGLERQALCEAVQRFNAEGLAGSINRPAGPAMCTSARSSGKPPSG
ncbi:hypothetical protein [Methylobacterium terricola]|uniref:hypothetical protein n=1 Tax=Methylobacterium terricola TaxID=2583531 RepID=UPI003CCC7947